MRGAREHFKSVNLASFAEFSVSKIEFKKLSSAFEAESFDLFYSQAGFKRGEYQMVKHKDYVLPEEVIIIVANDHTFKITEDLNMKIPFHTVLLQKAGIKIDPISLFAISKEELIDYTEKLKVKFNEFAYYKPNHSILCQIEGRKSDRQKSTRKELAKRGIFMDCKFDDPLVIEFIKKNYLQKS